MKINAHDVKKGDILFVGKEQMVIIGDNRNMPRKPSYQADAIKHSQLDQYLNGKMKSYYTVQWNKFTDVEKVGEYNEFQKILNAVAGIKEDIFKSENERYETIKMEYDSQRRQYFIELPDGKRAYAGEMVIVKFKNGRFPMYLGNSSGKILQEKSYIYVRRRLSDNARSVNFKNIIEKAS